MQSPFLTFIITEAHREQIKTISNEYIIETARWPPPPPPLTKIDAKLLVVDAMGRILLKFNRIQINSIEIFSLECGVRKMCNQNNRRHWINNAYAQI